MSFGGDAIQPIAVILSERQGDQSSLCRDGGQHCVRSAVLGKETSPRPLLTTVREAGNLISW